MRLPNKNEMSSNVVKDVREVGKILKGRWDKALAKEIDHQNLHLNVWKEADT